MPVDASRLLAKNIANFVSLMTADGKVVPDFEDEVISSACMTRDGKDAR
jgi:NAD(P) transhydrogenase subunit alpha